VRRALLGALVLAGLVVGVVVATQSKSSHSAERAIERRERQKLRHFADLEKAGRARVQVDRLLHEYAEKQAQKGSRVT